MAEMSDSVKKIRDSVMAAADASNSRAAYISNWNGLIDSAIAAVTSAKGSAAISLSLDKKAFALVQNEKAQVDASLGSVDESYAALASAISSAGSGGHDVLSVLNNYESMRSGPYASSVVMANYEAKMNYNIGVIKAEQAMRERDLETLNQLKI